jgi:hypothetical protein
MTATGQNFEMFQGDTKDIEIPVTDENGAALPLDPFTEIVWVVYKQTTKEEVLRKELGAGITVPSASLIKISLLPVDTELLTPTTYNHECEISDGGTVVSTITTGTLKILYSKA